MQTATSSAENYRHIVSALSQIVPMPVVAKIRSRYDLAPRPRPSARVPLLSCMNLVHDTAWFAGDPLLELRGFDRLHRAGQLFPGYSMQASGSLTELLWHIQRYTCLETEIGELDVRIGPRETRIQLQARPEFRDNRLQIETYLYSLTRLLARAGLAHFSAISLKATPAAAYRPEYERLYGVPVRYGQRADALTFPSRQNGRADQHKTDVRYIGRLECRLRQMQPQRTWTDSVRYLLPLALPLDAAPLDACAALLAVSRRTLQRRVEDEAQTFRDLLQDTRRSAASNALLRGHTCDRIAHQLGYRQTSQFYRAFRGWYGTSPEKYLTEHRAE